MDENIKFEPERTNCFKEAVCIDAMRVYDSCSEKDCTAYRFYQARSPEHPETGPDSRAV